MLLKINMIAAMLLAVACLPCRADMAMCAEPLQRLQQAIVLQPPADPAMMQEVLDMRHKAEQLCLDGDTKGGIELLLQALALFPAEHLPPMPSFQ